MIKLKFCTLILIAIACSFSCFAQDYEANSNPDLICAPAYDTADLQNDTIMSQTENISEVGANPTVCVEENDAVKEASVFDYKNIIYWQRYQKFSLAGWGCLCMSLAAPLVGYVFLLASLTTEKASSTLYTIGTAICFVGPVLFIASIPLLSIAYYNRHKAKHLKFDVGISAIQPKDFSNKRFSSPALSLSMNF